ncbi:hypothetical protein KI387_023635, partial [Taxus chinensis]
LNRSSRPCWGSQVCHLADETLEAEMALIQPAALVWAISLISWTGLISVTESLLRSTLTVT